MAKRLALLALLVGAGPLEEVFMVSPASGLTANLSNDPATSDTAPAWAPDGTRVALQRSGPVDGIWVLEVAAGTMAFVPHTDHGFQPAWSPDGGWLVFSRNGGGDAELWKIRADGSDLTQFTNNAADDWEPSRSPDGTRIAFARGGDQDDGQPFHIHTITLAGGRTTQVTSGRVQDLLPADAWRTRAEDTVPSRTRRTGP
jgi:Tol biopolymer transport system component